MLRRLAVLIAMAALLPGCALLTAEAPLLEGADDGGFVAREGLWAVRDPECRAKPKREGPDTESCLDWFRVSREADGAWRVSPDPPEADEPTSFRVRIAVAGERLYAAEASPEGEPLLYLAVGARGRAPYRRLRLRIIDCEALLAGDEPPEGVRLKLRDSDGSVEGCIAETPAAVLEAARRAAGEDPKEFERARFEWVRE